MSEREPSVVRPLNGVNGLSERFAIYDGFAGVEEPPGSVEGLVSLGFIRAAIRRRARAVCLTALAGLLAGSAYYVTSPASYKASTSVLLTPGPYENINTAASNDQAMAESRTVAGLAVQKLGLHQDPASFAATYTVAPITERVLNFTASAPSSAQAVLRASAVAAAFLQFRAAEMQSEQRLVLASLNQQLTQAEQHLNSLNSQINQLQGQPGSDAQLKSLRAERTQATVNLYQLQQGVAGNQSITEPATSAAVKGSVALDPALPLAHSRLRPMVLDVGIGLIAGLFLALAIVVIQALVSDRLRRRDNVAQALGFPVKLSIGPVRRKRWLPGWPSRGGSSVVTGDDGILRIAAHLGRLVPDGSGGAAGLAVVPVDDRRVPAVAVVSLAVSCAGQGKKVVVTDLCRGTPAARLLGVKAPGVHPVSVYDATLTVAVPPADDVVPVGPREVRQAITQRTAFTDEVAAVCESADLLLTLVALDPSLGSDHLTTWAPDVVVMVTAGQSSWTKIRGVSELIRLSGARLASAVLIGVDQTDESLGALLTPEPA